MSTATAGLPDEVRPTEEDDESTHSLPPQNACIRSLFCFLNVVLVSAPKSCNLHIIQAPLLAYLRPGSWMGRLTGSDHNFYRGAIFLSFSDAGLGFDAACDSFMEKLSTISSVKEQVGTLTGDDVLVKADFHFRPERTNRSAATW